MPQQRLEYIDFAKGFSILSIVLYHYCQPYTHGVLSKVIMAGGAGVHLFFVLSGFGLGLSSQNIGPFHFYRKRFVKILVPYFIFILFVYVLNSLYEIYPHDGLYALGGHLFFYKMFDENIIVSFGNHLWFMSTIIQFYIVFPLIILIKNKLNIISFLLFSLLLSVCYWVFISVLGISSKRMFNSSLFQFLWEFNVGIVLSDLYKIKRIKFWEQNIVVTAIPAFVGISLMGFLAIKGGRLGRTFNDIPASIGFASLSVFFYSICVDKIKFFKSAISHIGILSYELYLTHLLVVFLVNNLITKIFSVKSNIFFTIFFILPFSILIAHLFMEANNLFLKQKDKLFAKSTPL